MKMNSLNKGLLSLVILNIFSLPLYADTTNSENVDGFSAKQSEVVIKAFDILAAQMWDKLTEENLVTLSQAAAIAMDPKNEHYNPKAAFTFLNKILEVQYDYRPLSELTQKVFKSAVLSLMRGDYRFSSESKRVLRNPYEFHSDLRQMREMLKKAKVVEQRKANECLFVTTLFPMISAVKAEHLRKFKDGAACNEVPASTSSWCGSAYNSQEFCNRGINGLMGQNECSAAKTQLVQALVNLPTCANPVDIAGKLADDASFITIEEIEKTLLNEDTKLAFKMGLAVTDPATQRTYHFIRDKFHPNMKESHDHNVIADDEEFDLDGPSCQQGKKTAMLAIEAEAPKSKVQELSEFASTMDGPRFKSVTDARANKPILALGTGSEKASTENAVPHADAQQEPKPAETAPKTGFWNQVLGMFGY